MNQYYGSERVGKRRLAQLTLNEKEAAKNPLLGRSRAERMLDDSLVSLKKSRNEAVDPLTGRPLRVEKEEQKRTRETKHHRAVIHTSMESPIRAEEEAGSTQPSTANEKKKKKARADLNGSGPQLNPAVNPPYMDLLSVLNRLEYRPKFPRSIRLIHRFFQTTGKSMLDSWRQLVSLENQSFNRGEESSMVIKEAIDSQAWMVFYTAWRISHCSHVCNNGDARQDILRLFDSVLIPQNQTSIDAVKPPSFDIKMGQVSTQLPCAYSPIVSNRDVETVVSQVQPESNRRRRPMILLQQGNSHISIEPEEGHKDGSEEEGQKKDEGLISFLNDPSDWIWLYHYLIPICRIAALYHNLLYTDDPHIFHRGLRALESVFESIPSNYTQHREYLKATDLNDTMMNSDHPVTPIVWCIPNNVNMLAARKRLFMDALPTVFQCHSQRWARVAVEQFFHRLFTDRHKRFDSHEADMIETWQAKVKETAKEAAVERMGKEGTPSMFFIVGLQFQTI
eukprot:Protomagalhaensia_sp_Gyna_25__4186@NODE_37_length_6764_cov_11_327881_g26_i0_p2_GENE_NODE_37_length_6764_cov_11_327881_g26_i0NODE_37_length_6764_cov_11_327881_g26_i0_p2_ORF_typecomplete_len507_score107_49_NODE_37_length_6764_cov_11_327881_g26_i028584378